MSAKKENEDIVMKPEEKKDEPKIIIKEEPEKKEIKYDIDKLSLIRQTASSKAPIELLMKKRGRASKGIVSKEVKTKKEKVIKEIQQILNDIKKGVNSDDPTIINSYYISKRKDLPQSEILFYSELIKSRIYNTRLLVSDILNGKEFTFYLGDNTFDLLSKVFTNDKLYWLTKYYVTVNTSEYKNIINLFKINFNDISLQTLGGYQTSDYKKGYIQDYNEYFSFCGYNLFSKDEKTSLLVDYDRIKNESGTFTYDNVVYTYKLYENGAILCFSDSLVSSIPQAADKKLAIGKLIEKMKLIPDKRNKKDTNDLKVYSLKSNIVYLSQMINATNFVPGVVELSDSLNYGFLFKTSIDMSRLEDFLYKKLVEQKTETIGKYLYFENLVTWDTFNLMINFLLVESFTKLKDNPGATDYPKNMAALISKCHEEWLNIREAFMIVKSAFEKALKIFVKFFECFQLRIPVDLTDKFKKTLPPVKEAFVKIDNSGYIKPIFEFLNKYDLKRPCITIYNALKTDGYLVKNILRNIDNYLSNYTIRFGGENFEKGATLIEETKKIGNLIWEIFNIGNNEDRVLINEFKTPTLFLGDLLVNDTETAKKSIKKINIKINKEKKEEEEDVIKIAQIKSIPDDRALLTLIILYFKYRGLMPKYYKLNKKEAIFKGDALGWYNDEKILDKIKNDNKFASLVSLGTNAIMKKMVLPELDKETNDYLKLLFIQLVNYLEKKKLKREMFINDTQAEINKLKTTLDEIKSKPGVKIYKPIEADKPITLEMLINNEIPILSSGYSPDTFRKQSITDDILKEYVDQDIIEKGELPSDQMIKYMKEDTYDRWGPEGYGTMSRKTGNYMSAEEMEMRRRNDRFKKENKKIEDLYKSGNLADAFKKKLIRFRVDKGEEYGEDESKAYNEYLDKVEAKRKKKKKKKEKEEEEEEGEGGEGGEGGEEKEKEEEKEDKMIEETGDRSGAV